MLLFFFIIAVSGTLGGLIFALDSSHTHSLSIPWDGKEISTGWFGHVVVGIGGAIVTIGAAVPIFNLDLVTFTSTTIPLLPVVPLELILYLLAFGVLGGYSGLRIISGMSDAMIKKLEQEVEAKVNETTQEFRDKLAKNIRDDRTLKQDIEKYKDDHDLMKGAFLTKTGKADEAIEILIEQTNKHPNNHKGWMWLGNAYKVTKQYKKALDCSIKAVQLSPDVWSYYFNCACYSSLDEQNDDIILDYLKTAVEKYKKDDRYSDMEMITQLFNDDEDLNFIKIKKEIDIFSLLS